MGRASHRRTAQKLKNNNPQPVDKKEASFVDHIRELRGRVFWVVLLFLVASVVAYSYHDLLIHVILNPLGDEKLIYLNPAGGFNFIFQVTMYAGGLVTAPFLIFQLYKFILPALPRQARRYTPWVFIAASLLMVGGVLFGYVVAIPAALKFLTTFGGEYVSASLTADSYLSFILSYLAGLGLLFQLPLLLMFWHSVKPFTPGGLLSSERYVIIFAFVAAAIITPTPDAFNQALIAVPIIAIYQFGVVAILISLYKKKRRHPAPVTGSMSQNLTAATSSVPRRPVSMPVVPVLEHQPSRLATTAPRHTPVRLSLAQSTPQRRSMDITPRQRQALRPEVPASSAAQASHRMMPRVSSPVVRHPAKTIDGFMVPQRVQKNA